MSVPSKWYAPSELADVLSAIICRIRRADGTVPLVVAYDIHERVWNPPMPAAVPA